MKYVLVHVYACDWPTTNVVKIFSDRGKAVKEWYDDVADIEDYCGNDPERLVDIKRSAREFLEDTSTTHLEWVCNNDGPVEEMVTIELIATEES